MGSHSMCKTTSSNHICGESIYEKARSNVKLEDLPQSQSLLSNTGKFSHLRCLQLVMGLTVEDSNKLSRVVSILRAALLIEKLEIHAIELHIRIRVMPLPRFLLSPMPLCRASKLEDQTPHEDQDQYRAGRLQQPHQSGTMIQLPSAPQGDAIFCDAAWKLEQNSASAPADGPQLAL